MNVPRLRIDMEGWTGKNQLNDNMKKEDILEAEDSLRELDLKRKAGEEPSKRKSKRIKLEKLVDWGKPVATQACPSSSRLEEPVSVSIDNRGSNRVDLGLGGSSNEASRPSRDGGPSRLDENLQVKTMIIENPSRRV